MATLAGKERYVHDIFGAIARHYDLMNMVMSAGMLRRWQAAFARVANLAPGQAALDVCTGTGELAMVMARQVGASGRVAGLDFSPEMLAVAREKVDQAGRRGAHGTGPRGGAMRDAAPGRASHAAAGLGRIDLVSGNAMDLPFADSSFDVAAIGFALRNVTDIGRVLAEMTRVVRPGGRVVSLELSKPENRLIRGPYYLYFYHVVPLVDRVLAAAGALGALDGGGSGAPAEAYRRLRPYRYLPRSLTAFPDRAALAGMMSKVGLVGVQTMPLSGGVVCLHWGIKPQGWRQVPAGIQ